MPFEPCLCLVQKSHGVDSSASLVYFFLMVNVNNAAPIADPSSHRLGNYRLVRLLGKGGFAHVYLGEHLYLKRLAAIKVLRAALGEREKEHFLEEAKLLANLVHPHIVRVLEFAVAQRWVVIQNSKVKENIPFLVMDYAPGGSLRACYPAGVCLPLNVVIANVGQVAAALQYAHERNVIHRDIKPENLLINERQEIMLSDFGLALFTPSTPSLLSLQGMAGTLSYAAPEQLQGRPGFASDQYSLAIIAYEWLCGSLPFGGTDIEIIMDQVSAPPPRPRSKNPAIPQLIENVLLKALAKDPWQRFGSVQAFAQALEQAGQIQPSVRVTRPVAAVANPASPTQAQGDALSMHALAQNPLAASPGQHLSRSALETALERERVANMSVSMQRDRLRMIQKVRAYWVNGVLEEVLHETALIPLRLEERRDIVASPWDATLNQAEKQTRLLPPGTPITEVYNQAGGELLILGEAGTGKTTLLLELTRHLLDRAEQDRSAPIPVIFLLCSWSEKQLPLEQWIVEELSNKYQVPHLLGEQWVRDEMILPLIDGLDEVEGNLRSACVTAINTYKTKYGLSSLVVCCRLTEYLLFPARVQVHGAIVVQPLAAQQVKEYLKNAGEKFESLYRMLGKDPLLQKLVTTPLMLNIITLAYQNTSPEDLLAMYSPMERYRRIWSTYIDQMLKRHPVPASQMPQQVIGWLISLARRMWDGQKVFYIEQLQPEWINQGFWLRVYMWLAVFLPGVLIGGLTSILANDLLFHAGMVDSIFIDGLFGAFMGYLFSGRRIEEIASGRSPVAQRSTRKGAHVGGYVATVFFTSLLCCLLLGLAKGWIDGVVNGVFLGVMSFPLSIWVQRNAMARLYNEARDGERQRSWLKRFPCEHFKNGIVVGQICGLSSVLGVLITQGFGYQNLLFLLSLAVRDSLRSSLLGMLISLLLVNNDGAIHRAEVIVWSWKRFWRTLGSPWYAISGLLIGSIIGLSYGLKQAFQANWDNVLVAGLSDGLFLALGYYLVTALLQGISSHNLDNRRRHRPNEGIHRSLYYSLIAGISGTCATASGYILSNLLSAQVSAELSDFRKHGHFTWVWYGFGVGFRHIVSTGLANVLWLGLVGGLLTGLLLGGLAGLQHGILRLILWVTGVLPLKLSRFLDYAADSVLLHRVGGGYMFMHRLLLEYFASLDERRVFTEESETVEEEPLVRML